MFISSLSPGVPLRRCPPSIYPPSANSNGHSMTAAVGCPSVLSVSTYEAAVARQKAAGATSGKKDQVLPVASCFLMTFHAHSRCMTLFHDHEPPAACCAEVGAAGNLTVTSPGAAAGTRCCESDPHRAKGCTAKLPASCAGCTPCRSPCSSGPTQASQSMPRCPCLLHWCKLRIMQQQHIPQFQ